MARDTGSTSRRPLVGVTGTDQRISPSWLCISLSVSLCGGNAVRLSVNRSTPVSELDAIVISGGDDIHPSLFGAEPTPATFYDVERDQMEQSYINAAISQGKPMLGICRGHQLINVTFGGTLHQDIRTMRSLTYNRRGLLPTKTLVIDTSSPLMDILGGRTRINSLHYQAVKDVADGFETAAEDLDGICQSIVSKDRRIVGVQWHPEYLFYINAHRNLFRHLINNA